MAHRKRSLKHLSDDDIRAIRALRHACTQHELAKMYDRSQVTIHNIQHGLVYAYVPNEKPATVADKPFDLDDWLARHVRPQPLED